jgi:hypothetical protein
MCKAESASWPWLSGAYRQPAFNSWLILTAADTMASLGEPEEDASAALTPNTHPDPGSSRVRAVPSSFTPSLLHVRPPAAHLPSPHDDLDLFASDQEHGWKCFPPFASAAPYRYPLLPTTRPRRHGTPRSSTPVSA